jgi:hypothetical protein
MNELLIQRHIAEWKEKRLPTPSGAREGVKSF